MKYKENSVIPVRSAVLTLIFLILFAANAKAISDIYKNTQGQHAAEKWGNGTKYAQFSVFADENTRIQSNALKALRAQIDAALEQKSVSENENGRLWIDAYSMETEAYVSRYDNGTGLSVTASAVGGDFFVFHPFELISGEYFSETENGTDKVVIDDYTAWKLFGATDVAGMDIEIDGKLFVISGVVKKESGTLYCELYGDNPRIYVSGTGYILQHGNIEIDCYELLLPNPVKGFAAEITDSVIGGYVYENGAKTVENSARFDFFNLLEQIKQLPYRSVRSDKTVYPYWENLARVSLDICAFLQIFECLFIISGALSFIVFSVKLIKNLIPKVKYASERISERIDKIKTRNYYKKNHTSI